MTLVLIFSLLKIFFNNWTFSFLQVNFWSLLLLATKQKLYLAKCATFLLACHYFCLHVSFKNSDFYVNISLMFWYCSWKLHKPTDVNSRGVVRTGATGATAPVDFLNMYFGTRRFKSKRLRNHWEDYLFMYKIGYWHPLIEIPNDAPE